MQRPIVITGAIALAATSTLIGTQIVSGASTSTETVFIPIEPCRLVDTRPGDATVGPIGVPIGEGQDVAFTAWGTGDADSPCDIPNTATAIATNATAVGPTDATFLTFYPADSTNPGTSNLNVSAGQAPTPNSANIPLSATGQFNVFNRSGNVNVIIDVNGYYQPSTAIGAAGPTGPSGPAGPTGDDGSPNRITDQEIARLDWSNDPGREARIEVGSGSAGIAFDGTHIYITAEFDNTVTVVDPTTNTVIDTIDVGNQPSHIAYNGTNLYVVNAGDDTVTVVDPTTNTVIDTIGVGSGPDGIAFNGTYFYVANTSGDSVAVIDPTFNGLVGPLIPVGDAPRGVAYDGTNIYVTNNFDSTVSVIDPTTNTVIGSPIFVLSAGEIAFDGTNIYVSSLNSSSVTKNIPV